MLGWTLRHRWISLGLGVVYFAGTIGVVSQLQAGFIPEDDRGYYYLNVEGLRAPRARTWSRSSR
jgi:multidrug efflux pump subunit AcrB